MTTSVKVKFRASRVPGKAGSIYYQVTHDRQVRRVATRIRIFPEWWDADAGHVRPLPGEAPCFGSASTATWPCCSVSSAT